MGSGVARLVAWLHSILEVSGSNPGIVNLSQGLVDYLH